MGIKAPNLSARYNMSAPDSNIVMLLSASTITGILPFGLSSRNAVVCCSLLDKSME